VGRMVNDIDSWMKYNFENILYADAFEKMGVLEQIQIFKNKHLNMNYILEKKEKDWDKDEKELIMRKIKHFEKIIINSNAYSLYIRHKDLCQRRNIEVLYRAKGHRTAHLVQQESQRLFSLWTERALARQKEGLKAKEES